MTKVKFNPDKCLACKTCELQCAVTHTNISHVNDAVWLLPQPIPRLKIITENNKSKILRCSYCKKPKCIDVCKSGALYIENGMVFLNSEKCDGCWSCIEVCPFKAIFKNELLGVAVKCDLCKGKDKLACVASCPTEALVCIEEKGDIEK